MVRPMKQFVMICICLFLFLMSSSSVSESVKMVELNYGKYQVPETLKRVISLQEGLKDEGVLKYGDLLGLYFGLESLESRYLNTPLDVISFARPGMDGIHYAFLTDFGSIDDLENAYIVRVSPMDFDDSVKIVARNIHDFLRILGYSSVELMDTSTNENEYKKLEKLYPDYFNNQIQTEDPEKKAFIDAFQIDPIDNIFGYYHNLKNQRERETVVSTPDGIGVVYHQDENENHQKVELKRQQTIHVDDIEPFFKQATVISKLAFLRDVQSKGIIYDNERLKRFLKEQLIMLNLKDEAARIENPTYIKNNFYELNYSIGISMISDDMDSDE
jgi:hypothetical protein